jgi:asparagine N-glycosylation enzyme membrane subunit Stt3
MNPQYEQYATFNDQANNPNESGSAIFSVILSAIVALIGLLLSSKTNDGVWIKIAVVAVLLAAFKAVTYVSKIKAFYKEK